MVCGWNKSVDARNPVNQARFPVQGSKGVIWKKQGTKTWTFCSGKGLVDPGTAGRLTGQQRIMRSPPNPEKISIIFWLTGWLSRRYPAFEKVYVLKLYVPFSPLNQGSFVVDNKQLVSESWGSSNHPWPQYFCKSIAIQMGGVSWYKVVVKILFSAKRRAYFCKSIAIEMGGVSR